MMKTWTTSYQRYLIECRAMEEEFRLQNCMELNEVPIVRESIQAILAKFEDVSEWLGELPSRRSIEHHIISRRELT